jgi:hypothetical protein
LQQFFAERNETAGFYRKINIEPYHQIELYSLLLGTPTGAALDLLSTDRDSCFTASLGRWRGLLSHSPPSTTNVVPLTYFPYSRRHAHKILSLWQHGEKRERKNKGDCIFLQRFVKNFKIFQC